MNKSNLKKVIKKNKKPLIILGSILLVILIVFIILLTTRLSRERVVIKELDKINALDITKDEIDMEIKSSGELKIVEEAIKNYYKDFLELKKKYNENRAEALFNILTPKFLYDKYNMLNDVKKDFESKNKTYEENIDKLIEMYKDYKITSCFFRICKKYLLKKGYDKSDWADNFVWSNIMKISPAKGGNPTDKEWKIQLEGCKKLFKQEIDYFSPKLVLMLTDFNWAYDFIKSLEINPDKTEITNRHKFIKGKYFYNDSTILVFERPEGKEEEKFVKKIIEMSQGEKNGRRTEY